MERRVFEVLCGSVISRTIEESIAKSVNDLCEYEFEFNGVTVIVRGDSDAELILRDWDRALEGYLGENSVVGPYPSPTLTAEELESDVRIYAENQERRRRSDEEYAIKQTAKRNLLQGALSIAPPFDVVDVPGWEQCKANNQDHYGGRVVRYAEEWGRLMQSRIESARDYAAGCVLVNGWPTCCCDYCKNQPEFVAGILPDFAEELSHLADDDGITAFMYGTAVSILAGCWRHGEQLRSWHNHERQLGTEGDEANDSSGVLNPAILVIETKEQ